MFGINRCCFLYTHTGTSTSTLAIALFQALVFTHPRCLRPRPHLPNPRRSRPPRATFSLLPPQKKKYSKGARDKSKKGGEGEGEGEGGDAGADAGAVVVAVGAEGGTDAETALE